MENLDYKLSNLSKSRELYQSEIYDRKFLGYDITDSFTKTQAALEFHSKLHIKGFTIAGHDEMNELLKDVISILESCNFDYVLVFEVYMIMIRLMTKCPFAKRLVYDSDLPSILFTHLETRPHNIPIDFPLQIICEICSFTHVHLNDLFPRVFAFFEKVFESSLENEIRTCIAYLVSLRGIRFYVLDYDKEIVEIGQKLMKNDNISIVLCGIDLIASNFHICLSKKGTKNNITTIIECVDWLNFAIIGLQIFNTMSNDLAKRFTQCIIEATCELDSLCVELENSNAINLMFSLFNKADEDIFSQIIRIITNIYLTDSVDKSSLLNPENREFINSILNEGTMSMRGELISLYSSFIAKQYPIIHDLLNDESIIEIICSVIESYFSLSVDNNIYNPKNEGSKHNFETVMHSFNVIRQILYEFNDPTIKQTILTFLPIDKVYEIFYAYDGEPNLIIGDIISILSDKNV